jgi:anti-sigma factor RsiW
MNHADLERELPWYLSATAPVDIRSRIERALPDCEHCAREIGELAALRDALVEIEAQATGPSPTLEADVMGRIDVPAREAKRRFDFTWLRSRGLAAYSLLATMAVVALLVIRPLTQTASDEVSLPPPERAAASSALNFAAADRMSQGKAASSAQAQTGADHASKLNRDLARVGEIDLIVNDVPLALSRIQRVTDAQFGAITGLEDDAPAEQSDAHTANVSISVPDDRFNHTLDALAALGGVTSRSMTTEDVTAGIVDGDARLRNLRHEEADLLHIMDRSGKIDDVLSVEQQLSSTRESIEQLDAEQKALRQRVAYATITVGITDEKPAPVASVGAGEQLALTWQAALHAVSAGTLILASIGIYLVAFAPYILIVAAIAYLAYRWIARRR